MRWDDIELATGRLHVRRAKGGATSVHPIGAKESRALRRLQREATVASPYVFVSERGAPLSVAGYQRMVARAGEAAGFSFLIHSHMLRHSCGYKLANDDQDTRAIQALSRAPFYCLCGALYGFSAGSVQRVLEGLRGEPTLSLYEREGQERLAAIKLAAVIAGAVIALVGVFMWAGAWAAMAALGFIMVFAAKP